MTILTVDGEEIARLGSDAPSAEVIAAAVAEYAARKSPAPVKRTIDVTADVAAAVAKAKP